VVSLIERSTLFCNTEKTRRGKKTHDGKLANRFVSNHLFP
jgi:hypothetical protein